MDNFDLISFYFDIGMNYNDIPKSLVVRHGVLLSKRHLIRLLKKAINLCVEMATIIISCETRDNFTVKHKVDGHTKMYTIH